jgi:hypothetical protein
VRLPLGRVRLGPLAPDILCKKWLPTDEEVSDVPIGAIPNKTGYRQLAIAPNLDHIGRICTFGQQASGPRAFCLSPSAMASISRRPCGRAGVKIFERDAVAWGRFQRLVFLERFAHRGFGPRSFYRGAPGLPL